MEIKNHPENRSKVEIKINTKLKSSLQVIQRRPNTADNAVKDDRTKKDKLDVNEL